MTRHAHILAVVPARSGSKGIPDKNMRVLRGHTLIGHAGLCLQRCPFVDRAILSTDEPRYAAEGKRYGLEAPFLRPPELSGDTAGALETVRHAWLAAEEIYGDNYDHVIIVEPTCPLRRPEHIQAAVELCLARDADSVVTVSPVDTKFNPGKLLEIREDKLGFYLPSGAGVATRQGLEPYYYRNGACYVIKRRALFDLEAIFTDQTYPLVIEEPLANIDEPIDLEWADFLLAKRKLE